MILYKLLKKFDHFELRKGIVKNPIFRLKMSVKRFQTIFAYEYKGQQVDFHRVFYHLQNKRKKYSKIVSDPRNSFDWV